MPAAMGNTIFSKWNTPPQKNQGIVLMLKKKNVRVYLIQKSEISNLPKVT